MWTRAQAESGPIRLLPNHLGLSETNELEQCRPTARPVSPLLASGGLLPAAWNAHDRHADARHAPTVPIAASRLKLRKSFMRTVTLFDSCASSSRLQLWKDSLTCRASLRQNGTGGGRVFAGWIWRGLAVLASLEVNRLRARLVRSKTVMRRWGYLDDAQSVDCDCGEPQTMGISCHAVY